MKKGDSVYVVPHDNRHKPFYSTILSIGRKYITIDAHSSCSRFDIETKESVDDSTGWNCRQTIYESEYAYLEAEERRARKKHLKLELLEILNNMELEQLITIKKNIQL